MYLTQALRRAVQMWSREIATVCADRTRTWLECQDRVARLAGALRSLGIAPGDRIAILIDSGGSIAEEYFFGGLGRQW